MEWISVKDRLPKEEGYYLVCDTSSDYIMPSPYMAEYKFHWIKPMWGKVTVNKSDGFYVYSHDYRDYEEDNATHWMPLPELPKNKD